MCLSSSHARARSPEVLRDLAQQLLSHEAGECEEIEQVRVKTGLRTLEHLPALIQEAGANEKFPEALGPSSRIQGRSGVRRRTDETDLLITAEDDRLVQLSVVLLICSVTVENVAQAIQVLTRHS